MAIQDAVNAAFGVDLVEQRVRLREEAVRRREPAQSAPQPIAEDLRSGNPLRPNSFETMVGQAPAKRMLARVVERAAEERVPLDHVLLVGPSGTGKSTFSHVLACELDVDVYEVEAPVSQETLLSLRTVMKDRDILRIEEIHQQAIMERRGKSAATEPEVLYNVLEDRTIVSGSGVLPFPAITIVGTTTDEGLLPEPFLNRFPLRPRLVPYTEDQLTELATANARDLGMVPAPEAMRAFAKASRGVPRQINNYLKNARSILKGQYINLELAYEVLFDLNGVTSDGLTPDMKAMLCFLYEHGGRTNAAGETFYQASLSTLATGIGKARDVKAIVLRVEPFLVQRGWVQVGHGGRRLTDEGIQRAQELLNENG